MLYGAVIGDVLGSTFEFNNWLKSPEELPIFPPDAHPTDDSVLTCAVADALIASAVRGDVSENTLRVDPVQFQRKVRGALRDWGCAFPKAGYGSRFMRWMLSDTEAPTASLGNGSAMRASGCAWAAGSLSEALELAALSALPTHNHPEGVAGAQAAVWLIYRLREGADPENLRREWNGLWGQPLGELPQLTVLEASRPIRTDLRCSATLPVAAALVLGSSSYEETVRRAVALGGDCDTIAAIAGAAAEAAWGVPEDLRAKVDALLPIRLIELIRRFESVFAVSAPKRMPA